ANGVDGKDGKTPTVEQTPIKDAQGNTIGTTIIVKDGDGKEISRQDVLNGKDGAKGEKGDKGDTGATGANGKDGTNGVDGKDGKTPSVEQTPIKDAQGNTIGTTIIVKDGDGKEISRQDILNGKDGKTPSVEQ
ncbi:collagen-like surface protein, putative, partial [Staphylococcus simiae CCM 7213 = CCUG 51256]